MMRVDNGFLMMMSIPRKRRNFAFAAFVLLLFAASVGLLLDLTSMKEGNFTTARSTTLKTPVPVLPILTTPTQGVGRKPYELPEQHAKFVPFPHRPHVLGVEVTGDNICQWISIATNSPLAAQLTSRSSSSPLSYENHYNKSLPNPTLNLDAIQRAAFKDTICLPADLIHQQRLNNTEKETQQQETTRDDDVPHVFSTSEANSCLRNKTIIVAGDSYMKQLYIGLIEILAGRPSYEEIQNAKKRDKKLRFAENKAKDLLLKNDVDVRYECYPQCYPYTNQLKPSGTLKGCSSCLQKFHSRSRDTLTVLGLAVHLVSALNHSSSRATEEILRFIDEYKQKLIFVSPPSYEKSKVPLLYQNNSRKTDAIYWALRKTIPESYFDKVRYMDVFQMTRSCIFENCTSDGGHRARFVNRWKAQMLLNVICEIS